MRPIDADAIQYDQLLKTGNKEHPLEWAVSQSLINSMPTIKVEPKHGRWELEICNTIDALHTYQQYRCSVCGMTYITHTNYCPNCGSRMDLESEDD